MSNGETHAETGRGEGERAAPNNVGISVEIHFAPDEKVHRWKFDGQTKCEKTDEGCGERTRVRYIWILRSSKVGKKSFLKNFNKRTKFPSPSQKINLYSNSLL